MDDGVSTATPGGTVIYTIVASNAGPDIDPAVTVTDTFPPALSGCSVTSVAVGGATGNDPGPTAGQLADSGISLPPGSSVTYTATCTFGTSPGPTLVNTATVTGVDNDPNTTNNTATDTDAVGASLAATKTASGAPYVAGGTVTYTIVLTNGGGDQADNPGPELVDVLPSGLALVSASASSGTLVSDVPTNSVTWNGSIPAGGTVTITIQATILPGAVGKTLANQASIAFDANGDGTNETAGLTDDPTVAGGPGATLIQVAGQSVVEIPTLAPPGLAMLLLALATAGLLRLRRRLDCGSR
jgi:large repetitive protein